MRGKSLEDLRKTLLYNSSIDIWMTLCREKNWDWRNLESYGRFVSHLKKEGIRLTEAKMGSPIRVQGKPLENYIIRLDDDALMKIKTFS